MKLAFAAFSKTRPHLCLLTVCTLIQQVTVCTLIQQTPPTHSPSCLARAASHHPVDRTLTLLYECFYPVLCCCFLTDKFVLKPLALSPVLPRINSWLPSLFPSPRVTPDKLVVPISSPVVTLDKLKLTHQSFCPLLYSTSTRYKTIILELVRNSSGHYSTFQQSLFVTCV